MSIDPPPAPPEAQDRPPVDDEELGRKLSSGGSREALAEVGRSKYGSKPLWALFALFMFDEFDTGAFNVLAPDIQRDFDLSDQTESTAMVAIQGPKVIDRIAELLPVDVRSLKRYGFDEDELLMTPISVFRSGYTGEDGV